MTPSARFLPDLKPDDYHQSHDGPPRLSQSIAKLLCEASPWHAKQAIDRQAPPNEEEDDDEEEEPAEPEKAKKERDRGTIIHAYLLGTAAPFGVVCDPATKAPFRDFRTKIAREQKAAILKAGKIPMIGHKVEAILRQADRLRNHLFSEHGIDLVGRSELAVEWNEHASSGEPVPCRGMLDHWMPERRVIFDLKIWKSANPQRLPRQIVDNGLDIQAEAYTRAVEQVHPELAGRVRFIALICEAHSGLTTPIELDGITKQLGRMRWRRAIDLWARCMAADDWPGYTRGVLTVGVGEYQLAAEMQRAAADNRDDELEAIHEKIRHQHDERKRATA